MNSVWPLKSYLSSSVPGNWTHNMIIRSKSRLLVQQEVSAVPRTAGMEEKQEIFELWLLSFFLIVHIKLDLRCQVMKTLELPTSHLQTNCSHCFPVFSARMINNWSICGSADGGWKLPLMVLPMFCDMDADSWNVSPRKNACVPSSYWISIFWRSWHVYRVRQTQLLWEIFLL